MTNSNCMICFLFRIQCCRSQATDKYVATNINSSQLSIASTPGSITSTDQTCSSDWPDPPEPPICSTEDEAGSIVTDSDEIIPQPPPNMVPNGTYVIRKGRKERQRLIDFDGFQTFTPPDINDDNEDDVDHCPPPVVDDSANDDEKELCIGVAPNYRHSIDLAMPTPSLFPAHSPR